jgi:hypothetical protein
MYPIAIGAIVLVCTFGGAMVAMYDLSPASIAVIRLAMAFVVALATLVISLMISLSRRAVLGPKLAQLRLGNAAKA